MQRVTGTETLTMGIIETRLTGVIEAQNRLIDSLRDELKRRNDLALINAWRQSAIHHKKRSRLLLAKARMQQSLLREYAK